MPERTIEQIAADRELTRIDELIATKVMGWTKRFVCCDPEAYGAATHDWCDAAGDRVAWADYYIDNRAWSPTRVPADARDLMMHLAHLVGDFQTGDGFFHLTYADSGDHGGNNGCDPGEGEYSDDDDGKDLTPWSCHLHVGLIGEGVGPSGWVPAVKFCVRGATPELAICNVALKAYGLA